MTSKLEEHIEDYLNGRLSDEETVAFEKDLTKKEVANAFREVLIMRELLSSLPSDEPPAGLADRIEASLGLETVPKAGKPQSERISQFGHAVNGFKWGLRWPGYVLGAIANETVNLKRSLNGLNTIGYTLGPLKEPVRDRANAIRMPDKPLWKIALSKLW